MSVTHQTVLKKRADVVSRSLEDARIVLRLDRTETLVFNASANQLWDLFDGTRTVATVAALSGHDVAVLATFAAQLVDLGLFESNTPPESNLAEALAPAAAPSVAATVLPAPELIAREELAVLGGCTSSGLICSFPSSGVGGASRAGRSLPPPPVR